MTRLPLENLNSLAELLASTTTTRHSEWLDAALVDEDGDLYIEIAAPAASDLSFGLWIATWNGEVTVGFDDYHRHFGDGAAPDGGASQAVDFVNAALDLADRILAERIASVSWFDTDRMRASGGIEADRPFKVESAGFRIRIRSWSGKFNRDIPQPFAYRIGLRKPRVSKARVISEG